MKTYLIKQIVDRIANNKSGMEDVEKNKLYKRLGKRGIDIDCKIEGNACAGLHDIVMQEICELLVEKNLSQRQKLGELTMEDIYPLVRQTVSFYNKTLREKEVDPEDIVQNVMIKVYNNWNEFRGECQITTWVWRIVKNEVINMLIYCDRMKRKATSTLSVDDDDIDFEDGNGTLEDQLINAENEMRVKEMIESLPQGMERNILLMVLQGHDYRHIVNTLGTTYATVRVIVHEAKKMRLDDEGE